MARRTIHYAEAALIRRGVILAAILVLAAVLVGAAGSVQARQLAQDPTATPNATQAIETARAYLPTVQIVSTVRYGDIANITIVLCLAALVGLIFVIWLISKLVTPP